MGTVGFVDEEELDGEEAVGNGILSEEDGEVGERVVEAGGDGGEKELLPP